MGLSIITLALARKYAQEVATERAKEAMDAAILEAVSQSKIYTDEALSHIISFNVKIVDALPTSKIDDHTIYFVKRLSPSGRVDYYYEYMYINKSWELIGSTELDLSNYWTIDEVKAYVQEKEYDLPIASDTRLGGVKISGKSIVISEDGSIEVNDDYVEGQINVLMDDSKTIDNIDIDHLFD